MLQLYRCKKCGYVKEIDMDKCQVCGANPNFIIADYESTTPDNLEDKRQKYNNKKI